MTNNSSPLLDGHSPRTRSRPPPDLTPESATNILSRALPGRHVSAIELLSGGIVNANFKLYLDSENDPLVLRFYARGPAACLKEADIYRLVRGSVPVPEVLYAAAEDDGPLGPFMLLRYIEGMPFRDLRRTGDQAAIAEAAYEIGRTLAAIGEYQFAESGWFASGLEIGGKFIEGSDSWPRFCESCLTTPSFLRRAGYEFAERVRDFVWRKSSRLDWLEAESKLVHSDFGARNVLVRQDAGKWNVAAVIDWEFAFSGSQLFDLGNFLRYERRQSPLVEPHFSRGFVAAGGTLPRDWRQLARLIDLTALCEHLTKETLPAEVESELLELIQATIEDRDPK